MGDRATAVNPRVLRWARERAGYELDEVASKLKRSVESVIAWESGSDAPTFRQLEELAEVLYKRPVAIFFFPEPPPEPDPKTRFRTIPASELEGLHPDTLYAIREALSFQESLRELGEGRNPAERLIIRDIRGKVGQEIDSVASAVRDYLGTPLSEQFSWLSAEDAFKQWRRRIEAVGVFVFKRSFKQEDISGFCLHDDIFPVVMVNNSTAQARQTFTLFHELGHLLFAVGGITKEDIRYIGRLTGMNREIEVACNAFAAELLVPESSFPWGEFRGADLGAAVERIAIRYRVSREVILRRLLDHGVIDEQTYDERVAEWNQDFRRSRARRSGGGNFYATRAVYLGEGFLRLGFGQYLAGRLSLQELANHFGMKAKNVTRLQDFIIGGR